MEVKIQYIALVGQSTSGLGGRIHTFDADGVTVLNNEEDISFWSGIPGVVVIKSDSDIKRTQRAPEVETVKGKPMILARPPENETEIHRIAQDRKDVQVDTPAPVHVPVETPAEKAQRETEFSAVMGEEKPQESKSEASEGKAPEENGAGNQAEVPQSPPAAPTVQPTKPVKAKGGKKLGSKAKGGK